MSEYEGHTPGPWSVEGPDMFGDFNIIPPNDVLALGAVVSNLRRRKEVAANARLIAAAPTLLAERDEARAQRDALAEALREWTDAFVAHHQAYDLEIEGDDQARRGRAAAALEKARGT